MAGLGHRQDRGVMLPPLDEIDGFMVRPGFYNSEGAVPTARGVSFTIHSVGATGCTLLLFRPQEKEPYARLKYPEAYHVGNTFAMLVFGLKIEEFEYAYQFDGPYDEAKGKLFLTKKIFFWIHMHRLSQDRENGASVRKVEKISYIRRAW